MTLGGAPRPLADGPAGRGGGRAGRGGAGRLAEALRRETVGGVLLLLATLTALVWANSPWSSTYADLRDTVVGPSALHLDLTLGRWAGDGLLAVFFFVAGLELKRELVTGALRDPRRAALPVAAAVGGMAVPAGLFVLVMAVTGTDALRGWAVPTATDVAFALAVLAVAGRSLPAALRTFLLALAVVDDLLAITVIALVYTSDLAALPLLLALVPLALFALLARRGVRAWYLLLPLAVATWALVHASGVHATVAGVLLGFAVPVAPLRAGVPAAPPRAGGPGAVGPAEHLEHRWRPVSAGVAVPAFAFSAAGVALGGPRGLLDAAGDPLALGVVLALVVGKALGVLGASALLVRCTRARLDDDLAWGDVLAVAVLAGIGFTVSLLIGELAFGAGSERDERAKVGVLLGSALAALLATGVLRVRAHRVRAHRDHRDHPAHPAPTGAGAA